jgi:hypothetical protein
MGLSQGEEFFINSYFNNLFMNSRMSLLGVIVKIALVGTTLSITPILIQQAAGILGGQGGRHTSGKLGVPMATSGQDRLGLIMTQVTIMYSLQRVLMAARP